MAGTGLGAAFGVRLRPRGGGGIAVVARRDYLGPQRCGQKPRGASPGTQPVGVDGGCPAQRGAGDGGEPCDAGGT